jgi:hypothetical protein
VPFRFFFDGSETGSSSFPSSSSSFSGAAFRFLLFCSLLCFEEDEVEGEKAATASL